MRTKTTVITLLAFVTSGCAGIGPMPVMTTSGISAPKTYQYPSVNLLQNFQSAASTATSDRTTDSYQQFMRAGFALIYVRCGEYFDQKGSDQANVNLIKDSIAPITAVIAGIMSLHTYKVASNAGRDLKTLALGTSATISVFDVYTEHFLFGADNVNSVKQHTLEELGTHSKLALGLNPTNLEEAAIQIFDNQDICTPAHILASTREAISKGKFEHDVSGEAGAAQSKVFLTRIGEALGLNPPTITDTEAGVLYAWTMGFARTQSQLMLVHKKLSGFPAAANPVAVANGRFASNVNYPNDKLRNLFVDLPPGAQAYLQARAKKIMGEVELLAAQALSDIPENQQGLLTTAFSTGEFIKFLAERSDFDIPPEQSGNLRRIRLKAR